jgi:hypothetical protein
MTARSVAQHRRSRPAASPEGNEHLTAMTGAVLLVGFAIEGLTILQLHRLLWLHFVVGFLLLGPVTLKICSTLYRFARYYTRSQPYVRRGAPAPLLRVLGPLVVLTSLAVLGTGVILAYVGPGPGNWLFLHKVSFVLWFGVMTIHVCAYAPRLPPQRRPGCGSRRRRPLPRARGCARGRRPRRGRHHAPVRPVGRLTERGAAGPVHAGTLGL